MAQKSGKVKSTTRQDPLHQAFVDTILSSRRVALIPHKGPDADALGASLGLCHGLIRAGKEAQVLVESPPAPILQFLPGSDTLLAPIADISIAYLRSSDLVLVCDTHEPRQLGMWLEPVTEIVRAENIPVLVIDHHQPRDKPFFRDAWIDKSSSSTAEMVLSLLRMLAWQVTPEIAQCLMAGIVGDTFRFANSNTRPETFRNAADLLQAGANVMTINERLYSPGSISLVRVRGKILSGLTSAFGGRYIWATVTTRMLQRHGIDPEELSGLTNELKTIEKAKVVAVLYESGVRRTRVSLRSLSDYNVGRIAAQFPGGGGHALAAGYTVDMDIATAAEDLKRRVGDLLA